MLSAVTAIHNARSQVGYDKNYSDACPDCRNILIQNNDKFGCHIHICNPVHWRTGNPKTSTIIRNALRNNTKQGSNYLSQGDSPLTPWEVLSFRTFLLARNDLFDFSTWLFTLISIKLFLRESECAAIKIEDFVQDLFIVNDIGVVSGIAVKIEVCHPPLLITP
jgi:hypothetical protein